MQKTLMHSSGILMLEESPKGMSGVGTQCCNSPVLDLHLGLPHAGQTAVFNMQRTGWKKLSLLLQDVLSATTQVTLHKFATMVFQM